MATQYEYLNSLTKKTISELTKQEQKLVRKYLTLLAQHAGMVTKKNKLRQKCNCLEKTSSKFDEKIRIINEKIEVLLNKPAGTIKQETQ